MKHLFPLYFLILATIPITLYAKATGNITTTDGAIIDFSASSTFKPPQKTISSLPTPGEIGRVVIISDGINESDCSVGGGSNLNFCVDTGSSWVILGDGGGTATSLEWGNITGTLSNQTDLQNELNNKQNLIDSTTDLIINSLTTKSLVTSADNGQWWIGTGGNNTINPSSIFESGDYGFTWYNGELYKVEDGIMTQLNEATSLEWGNITGTLSNQTDLQSTLNEKETALTTCSDGQVKKWDSSTSSWICGNDNNDGGSGNSKNTIHLVNGDTTISPTDMIIGSKYVVDTNTPVKFNIGAVSTGDTTKIIGLYNQTITVCPDSNDQFILAGNPASIGYPIISSGSANDEIELNCIDGTRIIATGSSWTIGNDNSACINCTGTIGNTNSNYTTRDNPAYSGIHAYVYTPNCSTDCTLAHFGTGHMYLETPPANDGEGIKFCIYEDDGSNHPDSGDTLIECKELILNTTTQTGELDFPPFSVQLDCNKTYILVYLIKSGSTYPVVYDTQSTPVLYWNSIDVYDNPPSTLDYTFSQYNEQYSSMYINITN